MSQFQFLGKELADIAEAARKAEKTAIPDPRTSCSYARRALELAVAWLYESPFTDIHRPRPRRPVHP